MRDTKGYSVNKSAYAFVPVSEGNVLAPVWLQPDPTDRKRERYIAMKKQQRWRLGSNPVISELGHLLAKKKSI